MCSTTPNSPRRLLAVDVGMKTGFAIFDTDGRLLRYQSRKFSGRAQLKTAVYRILKESEASVVYLEGGGDIADVWIRATEKNGIPVTQVHSMAWRQDLLLPRQQRSGNEAKRYATALAKRIIQWSEAPRPTSLRHDVAEAIALGLWAVVQEKWLTAIPSQVLA